MSGWGMMCQARITLIISGGRLKVMSVFGNDTPNLSTEDAMRDSLQNLLPPDQRANYMSLFSRFLQQKQQAQKYTTALESWTEPEPV
jgi:hypothetical protein